jgi:hypothetical protein
LKNPQFASASGVQTTINFAPCVPHQNNIRTRATGSIVDIINNAASVENSEMID